MNIIQRVITIKEIINTNSKINTQIIKVTLESGADPRIEE